MEAAGRAERRPYDTCGACAKDAAWYFCGLNAFFSKLKLFCSDCET